jgi:hypothetical protein
MMKIMESALGLCIRQPRLERFPTEWNHSVDKKSLNFKALEHVLIEKVDQLFRNMLSSKNFSRERNRHREEIMRIQKRQNEKSEPARKRRERQARSSRASRRGRSQMQLEVFVGPARISTPVAMQVP